MRLDLVKMHGLGNDFVIVDARVNPAAEGLADAAVRHLCDRRRGVGCDQLIVVRRAPDADLAMAIFNADGSPSAMCGNAARCVAAREMAANGQDSLAIATPAGRLAAWREGEAIAVDMGPPRFAWDHIPLSAEVPVDPLPLARAPLADGVALSMGNPHVVFFVDRVDAIPLAELGPVIEHDALFPERTNVEIVEQVGPDRLRMRVWERGAGITQACGSGACATMAAARRRGLVGPEAEILLDGGTLRLRERADGHLIMIGPTAHVFDGVIDLPAALEAGLAA